MATRYRLVAPRDGGAPAEGRAPAETRLPFRRYLELKERYHQVDRALLRAGALVDFDLYLLDERGLVRVGDAREGPYAVAPDTLAAPGDVVIRNDDIPRYQAFIASLLPAQASRADEERALRALVIRENSKAIIKDLLIDPRSGERIKATMGLVNNLVDCMLERTDVLYDLIALSSYDYYTYTHSVNVAVLCVGMGIVLRFDRFAVESLGMGALLHDIGKSVVPPAVLNKPGRLTAGEYDIVKTHVLEGERILREGHGEIPPDALRVVLEHHERLSGNGYPLRLDGARIGIGGRICAIADSYDAMTTRRPYKDAMTPYAALSELTRMASEYDRDLLTAFIRMLGGIPAAAPPAAGGALT